MYANTERLEKELSELPGVWRVALSWTSDHGVRVGVVLERADMDLRDYIVSMVDGFAREHVDEISVDLDIVDTAHAAAILQSA